MDAEERMRAVRDCKDMNCLIAALRPHQTEQKRPGRMGSRNSAVVLTFNYGWDKLDFGTSSISGTQGVSDETCPDNSGGGGEN
jgi:hypothetical protein